MRQQQLTEAQIAVLFDPPTDQREMIRHYTLSAADLAAIRRCRGDHNRLGHALMLCYLRYPGRPLKAGERPPRSLLSFIAEQIDALPGAIGDYLAGERNRQRHAAELQDRLGFCPFGARPAADLAGWLLPHAIENDRLAHLAGLVVEECRRRRIVIPSPGAIERLCIQVRYRARREVQRRLTDGLSAEQRHRLDVLTQRRAETNQSWLAWLRQMPEAAKPVAMLGLIERLEHVRAVGLDPVRGHRVHQARLAQLAREAGRTTAQHIASYERQRRHAALVAVTLDLAAGLTDQAVDLFDRLIGMMFRKADERHARAFQADGRAINEKVRLYARVGTALIAARDNKQDPFDAITAVIPWDRFLATVAQAETLARSEEFDPYQMLGQHYAGIRRWAPAFLDTFIFQSVPAAAALIRAVDMLREINRKAAPSLPKSAPIGFIRERWARHVLRGGDIDRRYYELCVLSELRDRLRAGDIWVVGSQRYRAFEDRLISREALKELERDGTLPLAVDADFERFIADRRALLDKRLVAVDSKAKGGLLPDVTLDKGVLKITPIEKSTPPEAEALAARLYAMLPRIRITDLLSEVARWTLFTDCFTHLRTGEPAADPQVLMASLLADGLNLGLTRMAEACSVASLGQLAWTADWHIRDETHALALQRLVDHQQREKLAAMFGGGFASSSDGQFFRAGGFGRDASSINAHYGDEPGVKFYTHLSDRYAPFHIKVIAAAATKPRMCSTGCFITRDGRGRSPPHRWRRRFRSCLRPVLLARVPVRAPRIPDLKSRRLYSFGKAAAYPALQPLIAGTFNTALIRAPIGRRSCGLPTSIHTGTVTASLILRQELLASYPPARTASPPRCASWGGWNGRCSPSTGWKMLNCAARPARNSTKAKRAIETQGGGAAQTPARARNALSCAACGL